MSRKKDSPRPSERCGRGDLHPAPPVLTSFLEGWLVWSLWLAALSRGDANPSCLSQLNGFMKQWRSTPFGSEATQAKRWLRCQPRSYLRLEAYSFLGYPRGHRIDPETRCQTSAHRAPNERLDTLPRTRASQEPIGHHRGMKNLGDHLGSIRCSSCLRFQLFGVETFLLFPKCQSNGRDLARQCQTSHLRLHALGQQSRVKIMEWSCTAAGPGGRTLEDFFHLMVVVLIQTTQLLRFFGTLHLSANISVLRTVVRLNAQAAISPQLPLAAKPVRSLHQRNQARRPNRTDAGNLTQQFRGLMFPALRQQLGSQGSSQALQSIQLLIEQLGAAAHAGVRNPV